MDQGWIIALRNLYRKKKPKDKPTTSTKREPGVKKDEETGECEVSSAIPKVISKRSNLKHDQKKNDSTQDTFKRPKNLLCRGIVLHELETVSDSDIISGSLKVEMKQHRNTGCKNICCIPPKISLISSTFNKQALSPSHNQENNNPTILLTNQVDYS